MLEFKHLKILTILGLVMSRIDAENVYEEAKNSLMDIVETVADVTQETLAEPKVKETSNTQCLRYNTNPMLAIQENIEITCNKIDETNTSEECLYSQFSHNIFRIIEVTDEMVKFEMKYI